MSTRLIAGFAALLALGAVSAVSPALAGDQENEAVDQNLRPDIYTPGTNESVDSGSQTRGEEKEKRAGSNEGQEPRK